MNELTAQARATALQHAISLALHKDPSAVPSTADEIVTDAQTFFKFLKKGDNDA